MVSITNALGQVKDDLSQMLSRHVVQCVAQQKDYKWRDRLLEPATTILLFVTQVLHGNTAITHLRHLSGMNFSATAYCKARMRLPLSLLWKLCSRVTEDLTRSSGDAVRWHGHRVWHVDGSSFSMPDTDELREHFGQPGAQKKGCGFPVATLMVLCDAAGFVVKALSLPLRTHEASQVRPMHEAMEAGDVMVGDRGFCSYTHLALLFCRSMHGLFRMHQRQIVSFRPGRRPARSAAKRSRRGAPSSRWLRRLGRRDQLVRWFKPAQRPKWMSRRDYDSLPASLVLRELRYHVDRKGFRSKEITLVTTLVDSKKYPAAELAEQYLVRWDIELNFRHLKITMKMKVLKCKTVAGVNKELAMFILVYNLVRLVMLRASQRQQVPLSRISFIDALRWLQQSRGVAELIDLMVNPWRPGRIEPRVIKRRMKEYPLMKRPRDELRQDLIREGVTA